MPKSLMPRLAGPAALLVAALAQPALAADQPARFTVLIENVSAGDTLKLPDGAAIRAPIAPGAYAVYHDEPPIFRPGMPAGGSGLEPLAEDGNFEPMVASLSTPRNVHDSGMFVPGQSFEITARPGERLAFATMFVQSNDLFYGPQAGGIALFDADGRPTAGDLTGEIALFDAGTELNQAPGAGPDQAPRQAAPNTGASEKKPVGPVADTFQYPMPAEVIRITITPVAATNAGS